MNNEQETKIVPILAKVRKQGGKITKFLKNQYFHVNYIKVTCNLIYL